MNNYERWSFRVGVLVGVLVAILFHYTDWGDFGVYAGLMLGAWLLIDLIRRHIPWRVTVERENHHS